jgi:uncharacterized protein (DUF433 family)
MDAALFQTRETSGTSWVPDFTPMFGFHTSVGQRDVMLHGNAFVQFLLESGNDTWRSHQARGTAVNLSGMGDREFVERRDESLYLVGSRVPLASIVREFQDGQSPEAIRTAFPTLTLEQVYGAITFYLGHRVEVDEDLARREREERAFSETHPAPPDVKQKLERARDQLHSQ